MAITAQSILQRVVTSLTDESNVRWTLTELIRYFNDGQREIVTYRPDSTSTTSTVALVAGARQTIPTTAFKVLDVIRNTGGVAVRKIDMKLLDAQVPAWQSGTTSTTIKHYMYDLRDIDVFYVYPPAAVGASLEMLLSVKPTDISETTSMVVVAGNLSVQDLFANALQEYILYRAFAKDAEYAGNAGLAAAHYQAFQNAVGVEASATGAAAPKQ